MALKGYGTLERMHRSKFLLTSPANPGKDSFGVETLIPLSVVPYYNVHTHYLYSDQLKFWVKASFSLILVLLDVENKTRGHATVSSVTDCLNTGLIIMTIMGSGRWPPLVTRHRNWDTGPVIVTRQATRSHPPHRLKNSIIGDRWSQSLQLHFWLD